MWTRIELKNRAKKLLSNQYWNCFLVALVIAIMGGAYYNNSGSGARSSNQLELGADVSQLLVVILLGGIGLGLMIRLFIGYAVEVGGRKYFIKAAMNNEDIEVGRLGDGFKEGYTNIMLTMLLRSVFTFLWTLLFIIPGIIKTYSYRMVPYILADNPNINSSRAIELSNQMTDGHKLEMWVLDLSFIGWYLLGTLALFIGVIFVHPYVEATYAELYLVLRGNALQYHMTTAEELNMADELSHNKSLRGGYV